MNWDINEEHLFAKGQTFHDLKFPSNILAQDYMGALGVQSTCMYMFTTKPKSCSGKSFNRILRSLWTQLNLRCFYL